jgi:cytidylate kinase
VTTIAIDGPSGSGKSTLGRLLAERLGLDCLDTGAMYRSVALLATRSGIDEAEGIVALATAMTLEVGDRVLLNGEDVTAAIRTHEITAAVSAVAAQQAVRDVLVARQRAWVAAHGGGVVEGRDIGSVVLPDADVKVFLTAAVEERARRRAGDPVEAGGGAPVETVLASMTVRDVKDSTREISPLRAAPDALAIDSTETPPEAIVELVLAALTARTAGTAAGPEERSADGAVFAGDRRPKGHQRPVRPPGRGALAFYALCRAFVVGVSRLYYPGAVVGAERLPRTGPYILTPVHRSYLDWLIAARVTRRRLRFVVKAEVWKVQAVGRFIELLGAFPVHRGSADREALARCLEVLAAGEPLVVFPEGSRQRGLEVRELADGAAYMALRAGVPIFPLGLAGSEEAMPKGTVVPRPKRVRLVIGAPLVPDRADDTKRVSRREITELTSGLRAAIQQATDEARADLASRRHGARRFGIGRRAVEDGGGPSQ